MTEAPETRDEDGRGAKEALAAAMQALTRVCAERDEANRQLGAVAALADWGTGRDTGGVDRLVPASEIRAVLGPVSGPPSGPGLGPVSAPASGAVEGASVAASRERVFGDFDALHGHLLRLNEEGIPPDVSGYDRNGSPIVAWLDEEGGDCTVPLALTLGGEDASHPEPDQHPAERLAYPVLILDVSTPRTPVAGHEREVRADEAELYRVGRSYGIHVYSGDRPVATFHDADEAAFAVEAMNAATGRTGADEGLLSGTRDGMTG